MRLICLLFIIGMFHFKARAQTFAWARSMGGSTASFTPSDIGYSIKTDTAGNVYTTGQFVGVVDFDPGPAVYNLTSTNGEFRSDMFIQKLDSNGNFLWAKQLIGDSSSSGFSMGLDSVSNVYISGYFRGTKDFDPGPPVYSMTSSSMANIFILKLDVNGNFIWAKQMGGVGNEGGFGIALDNAGNVYTTGIFDGTGDFDPGPGIYNLVPVGNFDIFISKLDNSGNFVWAKQTGGSGYDYGNAITLDRLGNIYVTGGFTGIADFNPGAGTDNLTAIGRDVFIWKLNTSGNLIWAKQMVGDLSSLGYGIDIDSVGNVYYTGAFWGTVDFDPGTGVNNFTSVASSRDIFISKLDASGNFIWAKQIGASGDQESFSLSLDAFANCYITGFFTNTVDFDPGTGVFNLTAISNDIFIEKLSAYGNFIWAVSMGGPRISGGHTYGKAVHVNNNGPVYTTGLYHNIVDFDPGTGVFNQNALGIEDIFVQKLNQVCSTQIQPGIITGNVTVNIGQTINYSINAVTGATGYNWSLSGGGNITAGQNTPTVSVNWLTAGNYALSVNANNGCAISSNQTINVTVSVTTGVINPDNQFQIKITPNLSSGNFYLLAKGVNNKPINVEITNSLGQVIYRSEQKALTNEYSQLLNLGNIANGIYRVKIFIDKKIYYRAIVKID